MTFGAATISPCLPANTEADFSIKSASSPCPQASWKSTPPPPGPTTTGISPLGAGTESNLVTALAAALSATSSTFVSSNNSNPTVLPTDSLPVCIPASPAATQETEKELLICLSPVKRPSLFAICKTR